MSSKHHVKASAVRLQAIKEARERGLAGKSRPGDDLLFAEGFDPSSTYVGALSDAFHDGQLERKEPQS